MRVVCALYAALAGRGQQSPLKLEPSLETAADALALHHATAASAAPASHSSTAPQILPARKLQMARRTPSAEAQLADSEGDSDSEEDELSDHSESVQQQDRQQEGALRPLSGEIQLASAQVEDDVASLSALHALLSRWHTGARGLLSTASRATWSMLHAKPLDDADTASSLYIAMVAVSAWEHYKQQQQVSTRYYSCRGEACSTCVQLAHCYARVVCVCACAGSAHLCRRCAAAAAEFE